jgi:signal transduction histidine kinase
VAHEINQPLSEILLKSRLVLHELQGGGNGVPGGALPMILQGIVSDSQRIKQTIEKMRALLRNVPTTLIPINLRDVIDGSILYLKPRIKKETVKIHILEEAHLPSVAGDTQQLQLALSNLMRNALDALAFSPPENRVIRIEIKRSGGGIELTIEDSGPGIAPHLRAEIFEILTSSKPKGTGIGLYLARTAMTNHGGSIHHGESPLGGAQFQLRFPVHSKRRTRVAPQKS